MSGTVPSCRSPTTHAAADLSSPDSRRGVKVVISCLPMSAGATGARPVLPAPDVTDHPPRSASRPVRDLGHRLCRPVLSFAFQKPQASTFWLAVVLSTIALTWNYVFNGIFERWESRYAVRGRSFARRLAHGAGFEGGLVIILVPVMSMWLDISPVDAFLANVGLLAFFFVYAIAFTWAFDRVFGLPASAAK